MCCCFLRSSPCVLLQSVLSVVCFKVNLELLLSDLRETWRWGSPLRTSCSFSSWDENHGEAIVYAWFSLLAHDIDSRVLRTTRCGGVLAWSGDLAHRCCSLSWGVFVLLLCSNFSSLRSSGSFGAHSSSPPNPLSHSPVRVAGWGAAVFTVHAWSEFPHVLHFHRLPFKSTSFVFQLR